MKKKQAKEHIPVFGQFQNIKAFEHFNIRFKFRKFEHFSIQTLVTTHIMKAF